MSARVTVSIPLYNKEKYIIPALESVTVQTYRDFRILVVDDRSTDNGVQLVKDFMEAHPDIPIELIINERNLGPAGNGNRCLEIPDSEYIARFDADDLMPPQRLEKQVAFLDSDRDLIQVGGFLRLIGDEEKVSELPLSNEEIRAQMPIFTGISQGTSMFRTSLLRASGERYDEGGPRVGEDWLFFYKLNRKYPMGNIPEVMDIYRIHEGNLSVARDEAYFNDVDKVLGYILCDLGCPPSDHELKLHCFLRGQFRIHVDAGIIDAFLAWLDKLDKAYIANDLDTNVLKRFRKRALEQCYFRVDPQDGAAIERLKELSPMTAVQRKYLRRLKLKGWLGMK